MSLSGKQRLVVGMSGSSAPQLGRTFLEVTRRLEQVETHFVRSEAAGRTIELVMGTDPAEVDELADVVYDPRDLGAAIASGSFLTMGMVVIPCSMRTLGAIASGISDNLLLRAADVSLKERRPLILVAREAPLSYVHLRNMETATLAGATILPPVPALHHHPRTVDDVLVQSCGKVLDQLRIDHDLYRRWGS